MYFVVFLFQEVSNFYFDLRKWFTSFFLFLFFCGSDWNRCISKWKLFLLFLLASFVLNKAIAVSTKRSDKLVGMNSDSWLWIIWNTIYTSHSSVRWISFYIFFLFLIWKCSISFKKLTSSCCIIIITSTFEESFLLSLRGITWRFNLLYSLFQLSIVADEISIIKNWTCKCLYSHQENQSHTIESNCSTSCNCNHGMPLNFFGLRIHVIYNF